MWSSHEKIVHMHILVTYTCRVSYSGGGGMRGGGRIPPIQRFFSKSSHHQNPPWGTLPYLKMKLLHLKNTPTASIWKTPPQPTRPLSSMINFVVCISLLTVVCNAPFQKGKQFISPNKLIDLYLQSLSLFLSYMLNKPSIKTSRFV